MCIRQIKCERMIQRNQHLLKNNDIDLLGNMPSSCVFQVSCRDINEVITAVKVPCLLPHPQEQKGTELLTSTIPSASR